MFSFYLRLGSWLRRGRQVSYISLQGILLPLGAVPYVLEALAHAWLPGALVAVVASQPAEVNCAVLLGLKKVQVALFIVKYAGREPGSHLIDLDDLQRSAWLSTQAPKQF